MTAAPLQTIDTRRLMGNPRNPRRITTQALNRLCDSIRFNGFWQHRPMAVEWVEAEQKYMVLDGNQRLKALRRMKRREAPCIVYSDLTDEERTDIILRSNIENGEWDMDVLTSEDFAGVNFEDIGLSIDLPELPNASQPDDATAEEPGAEETAPEDDAEERRRMEFYYRMIGDFVYPTDNEYDIPVLLKDNMPVHLELPVEPWGAEARYKKMMSTYHFYTDDYRFEQLFKNPVLLLQSGCKAVVEPNCSVHDQTPRAFAIYQTFRKRYLCRYLQECGMQVWVDLNVSPHFEDVNALGVPDGYNAFFTRGVTGWTETLERHLATARRISGLEQPNLVVYGGGRDIEEWCRSRGLVHLKEYVNRARK